MNDEAIVQLYWDRSEKAITESTRKYGAYCSSIAYHILQDASDTEECVNDTWLRAWNAMPPQRPSALAVFLGKITRHLAFDRYRRLHRRKRGDGHLDVVLDELAECVSGNDDAEMQFEMRELVRAIDSFLKGLPGDKRYMFVRRYWYADGIAEIAGQMGVSENVVSVSLNRVRGKLRRFLTEEGFSI